MGVFIFGWFVGFFFSFIVLKASVNKSGYGQLKMCREKCPYYRSVEFVEEDEDEEEEDEDVS